MPSADDLADSLQFLLHRPPFDQLEEPVLLELCEQLLIHYQPHQQDQPLSTADYLNIIRSGAIELRNRQGGLVDRLHEGDVFGISSALEQNTQGLTVHTLEDCLLYRLPKVAFDKLMRNHRELAGFFRKLADQRQSMSALEPPTSHPLMQKVGHWMSRELTCATPTQSVQEGAVLMREARVSSLLIAEEGNLHGIVTDRDLRSRVLAEGLGGDTPLAKIMTPEPTATHPGATLLDAQWLMSEKQLHHLPVLAKGRLVGMLTVTDLMRSQEDSPLFFVQRLSREESLKGLARQMAGCRQWLDRLRQQDSALPLLGQLYTTVIDGLTRRLLQLGEQRLGAPPMAYGWLAFGSQARREMTLESDQDNGLILSREPDKDEAHYFEQLAQWVCDGLDRCGLRHCPGDVMASNTQWRLSMEGWNRQFDQWIESPTHKALMYCSIFFDWRLVAGPDRLQEGLRARMRGIKPDSRFIAMLTQGALRHSPPIGFFRSVLLTHSGEHKNQLDIKHEGLALVNDLARIHALAVGSDAQNTLDRLVAAAEHGSLSDKLARDLRYAWLLLTRLRQQRSNSGDYTGHWLSPKDLSPNEKQRLKAAFSTIKDAQSAALQHFAGGYQG
ncbi:DUF294 nucleotidyltransferase-like domain-containing protein [Marinimicrobium alkaliphilum]|uniref:DUF294 nucleotidyltransferase-like domain-containing protein n=1 Tax=Marinimicrobium alkaliphilum TaxID=2202654 RepID=UPI000DB95ACC|nr:DUF294 nucleotidyltransferase-like domain-containing protein [Marinimicrobium alkaliphilum]